MSSDDRWRAVQSNKYLVSHSAIVVVIEEVVVVVVVVIEVVEVVV